MVLQAGVRLGPYEIVGPLGAGGMGEVYKARDTRLDRVVAIKVLPASLAGDPVFRERFDREARTISSLDHPHICVLYDVGREAGVDYLVMQFLDGETLAERLARGPLPAAHALEYAAQMAAALDRAHRAGIVHRDLKPGNVMLTRAGAGSGLSVKLLDFGLAKTPILESTTASAAATMATPLTGQGTILGTLQYMAPEQLEGGDVDARTDVFALGAIVYEMLTARRAFEASSQAGVMAAILEKDPPPLSTVQPLTPPGLDRIVQRCLSKDPDARWQSARDLAAALSWVRADSGALTVPAPPRRARRGWILAAGIAAVLAIVALLAAGWPLTRTAERPPVIHAALESPPLESGVPEISPDGSTILWTQSADNGVRRPLWLQPLDHEAGRAIPGTEGATYAFWSPDSRQIGFFADQKLKRVAVSGGAPATLCDLPDAEARGGSWGADDVIIFSGARIGALSRVPASGGTPQTLTTLDRSAGHTTHRWPVFLPDGRHFLYFASKNAGFDPQDAIVFASLDGKESHLVIHATSNVAVANGRLLFVAKGRLVSQRFDSEKGTVSGETVPLLDNVPVGYGVTRAMFSAVGPLLVATPVDTGRPQVLFHWVAPDGSTTPALADSSYNSHGWLSPDGRRAAISIDDARARRSDVWTIDLVSGARTRLTFGTESRWTPAWSADGSMVFYIGERAAVTELLSKAPAGGDEVVVARNLPESSELQDCAADYCVFGAWRPEAGTNNDLLAVRLSDGVVVPVAATAADEDDGQVSPDGRLLAYTVQQAGEENVFVRTFPSGSGMWQISAGGGGAPVWSRDGHELYFLTERDLVSVSISTNGGFAAGPPRTILSRTVGGSQAPVKIVHAQIAPDGRVLAEVPRVSGATTPYRLVLNWNR